MHERLINVIPDELIEKGVTAIFCMNDFMAGGAYDRLYELGFEVGKDIVQGYYGFITEKRTERCK